MNDSSQPQSHRSMPGLSLRGVVVFLSVMALGIAVYLMWVSFVAKSQPLGCGENSGCAEVLVSRWSVVAGIPVSVPAAATYLLLIAVMLSMPKLGDEAKRKAWLVTITIAIILLFSAAWFIGLQVFYLKAICPWCMTEHLLGTLIAILILGFYLVSKRASDRNSRSGSGIAVPFLIATGLFGTMIALQSFGNFEGPAAERLASGENDTDSGTGEARTISMLDGKIKFAPSQRPMVGSPDSNKIVVIMFDYCCPHCRANHGYLMEAMQEYPDQLGVVMLPVPLNTDCNSNWEKTEPRFAESCDLARLALAVWQVNPAKFAEFDRWLFESPKPRKLVDATAHAESLVDADDLKMMLNTDAWIDETINENVQFYVASEAERLPVLLSPNASRIIGRLGSKDELIEDFLKSELGLQQP